MTPVGSDRPRLVIVGGPNGAGKTTLSLQVARQWGLVFLSADRVAEEESLGSSGAEAVRAGRLLASRIETAAAARTSILLESTLSGLGTKRLMDRFRSAGYDVTVILIFVDSPELCIGRIRTRVARGGHFVPDADVRRRFGRSLRNFWVSYRGQADRWHLLYNGHEGLVEIAQGEASSIEILDPKGFQLSSAC